MAIHEFALTIDDFQNPKVYKNGDAILEASVSLSDVSELDLLIKKMLSDKRIYNVHRGV